MIASITKCSKPTAWYKDHIHSEFVVIDEYDLAYSVRVSFDIVGYVLKSDTITTGILHHHNVSQMQYHYNDNYGSQWNYDQYDDGSHYSRRRQSDRSGAQREITLWNDTRRQNMYDNYMEQNFPLGASQHQASSKFQNAKRVKYGKRR